MAIHTFLSELKRRNVYRAAVVYTGVGWVLLEFADVAFPRLGLPDWTVNFVLALVLLGFPLAIVFAWIFDISTQGVVRTEPISPEAHHRFSITSIVEFVVICVLVITVGYLYVDRLSLQKGMVELGSAVQEKPEPRQPAAPNPEQYRAIAVLPFADMSEAGDQAWFAEGIAEELLHGLASVDELHVMARTSSFAFKDTGKTIAEIADILGVQAVLEGSVRRSGHRVRVTAQLIDASSGYHIWSGSYERQLTDIFQLQDELAKSIVETLRLELRIDQAELLIPEQTGNLEAYSAFMRGRAVYDWANPRVLNDAIKYFELAVAADPDYADAWGHLALARGFTALWSSTMAASGPTTIAYENALTLDPDQSEALTAKALMKELLEWDWETAGRLYRRALASQDRPLVMFTYATFYLAQIDELPRAVNILSNALELDPLHAGYKSILAMAYIWSGNAQLAIKTAKAALDINPQHVFGLMALIEAYTLNGDCSAALTIVENLPKTIKNEPRILGRAAVCHAYRSEEDKAREIYKYVMETTPYYHANLQAALTAMSLGEVDAALDVMESQIEKHAWTSVFIRLYFRHDESLKTNPRFLALLERIGLDDKSVTELQRGLLIDPATPN